MNNLVTMASGSVQKNFGPIHLNKMSILCPRYECVQQFEKNAGLILHHLIKNLAENDTLKNIRDTLLPKLISGEIRVYGSEKNVNNHNHDRRHCRTSGS